MNDYRRRYMAVSRARKTGLPVKSVRSAHNHRAESKGARNLVCEALGHKSPPTHSPTTRATTTKKITKSPHPGALQKRKLSRHRKNDVSRQQSVPQVMSGSVTSFRMSHEIVPVPAAEMSHHIVPVGTSAAGIAPRRRKTMSRDIVPHLVRIGPGHQRNARRKVMAPACASLRPQRSPGAGSRRSNPPRQ